MNECSHVKADGGTCRAAALRGQQFCYFHLAARDRIQRQRIAARRQLPLQLPILEDAATIQLAITDVINALLADRIDHKKAALILYALQTAAANVRRAHFGNADNSYKEYSPEFDPALPEIEEEEAAAAEEQHAELAVEPSEKKPAASASDPQTTAIIPQIHACIDQHEDIRHSPAGSAPRGAKLRRRFSSR